ncbi:CAP domain-containing protein [Ampelomyces quisqualis]|uniref:CAP domain-containing protein n=1 Tax=Ampelomyces quisqualis TaxID=50730 RepID=A0A6A5QSN5_AMPQU|nr:CAP domain-containing protein [Ampelomyces quisqualis]
MRNSALLASALAVAASAMPQLDKRATITRVRTEFTYATVTVVVFVTASPDQATPTSTFAGISLSLLPSSGAQSQPPIQTSSPIAGSLSLSVISSSGPGPILSPLPTSVVVSVGPGSSTVVAITPSVVVSSASSATSVASSAAPVLTPSAAAVSSSTAPVASPSPAPGSIGPDHVSGPQQAFLAAGADYENAILYHHNAARANHGAGPLTWDTACEDAARYVAQTCNFVHSNPPGVNQGQNLFTVSGQYFNVTAGITESWYKSELQAMLPYFGEPSLSDDVFHQVGHLTQVLWKGTTGVGCVSLDCGSRMIVNGRSSNLNKFTVCNYSPQGNIATLYAANVGFPISTTNLGSWAD